jgi:hypothetical protein
MGSNDDNPQAARINVIVMSEAGKPIFARFGNKEEETVRLCGLIQALRTSISSRNNSLQLGEIQSLRTGLYSVVFMTVESITLLAISKVTSTKKQPNHHEFTEAYLRLQLEYIFAQLIFTFTSQVQDALQRNPSLDLRSQLKDEQMLRGILDDTCENPGPFFVGGVQVLYPIASGTRDHVSKTLQALYTTVSNTAFAALVVGNELLSLVQPSYRNHQLRVSDLHLLMMVATRQQPDLYKLSGAPELWIPVCLPRLNSSGYFYAYISCLHVPTKLVLVLISPMGSTEQFQLFRAASIGIRQQLGLPLANDPSVVTVRQRDGADGGDTPKSDVVDGSRSASTSRDDSEYDSSDEDYVQISADGESIPTVKESNTRSLIDELHSLKSRRSVLLLEIVKDIFQGDETHPYHFVFRADITVKNCSRHHSKQATGTLTQCLVSPDELSCQMPPQMWRSYQMLSIRLRLGSATIESTMDAFDMISQDKKETGNTRSGEYNEYPGIAQYCPAVSLLESPPNLHGITHILDGSDLFLAMNGPGFEM